MTITIDAMRKSATLIWLLTSSAMLSGGCVRTELLKPELLERTTDKNIFIRVHGGREISLKAGDYQIIQADSQKVLQGSGREFLDSQRNESKPFHGQIAVSQLESIELTEKTLFYYTGPFLFVLFMLSLLVLRGNVHQ